MNTIITIRALFSTFLSLFLWANVAGLVWAMVLQIIPRNSTGTAIAATLFFFVLALLSSAFANPGTPTKRT